LFWWSPAVEEAPELEEFYFLYCSALVVGDDSYSEKYVKLKLFVPVVVGEDIWIPLF
jgi:hypothetical protein